MERYLLIERDGGITVRTDEGITSPERLLVLPFVQEAFLALEQKDVKTIILSDQSAIVPSQIDAPVLDAIHEKMIAIIEEAGGKVADILVNPNRDMAPELCAFPQPGLLHLARDRYGLHLPETPFIVSSYEGFLAGCAAKCRTVFVKTGKPYKAMQAFRTSTELPEFIVPDLLSAVVKLFP